VPEPRRSFSLTEGGPFHRVTERLGLTRNGLMRCWWFGILLWLPLVAGELLRVALGLHPDPSLFDLSLHARLLFGLPVLLASERLLGKTTTSTMASLYEGRFCDPGRLDPIVDRAIRLRDSWIVEAVLLALALLGGQLALWGVAGSAGWFHGGGRVGFWWSFPRVWYSLIALPIAQFVMFRWLWRWAIWSYMLARISRLPLAALATHADLAGGLTPLARPLSAFACFVLATGSVLAGAWASQTIEQRTSIKALFPELLAYFLGVLAVALGPLLLFCGKLYQARRSGLTQYGAFMREYTLHFHDKWIARPANMDEALGSPEIQSLSDLGNSFQVISKTRLFVFSPRNIAMLLAAAMLPAIPLLAGSFTVEEALKRILGTVLGGLPL
jgi:hypothetical protein